MDPRYFYQTKRTHKKKGNLNTYTSGDKGYKENDINPKEGTTSVPPQFIFIRGGSRLKSIWRVTSQVYMAERMAEPVVQIHP
jgi:hypothetical protein